MSTILAALDKGPRITADPAARAKFEANWGRAIPPETGKHLTQMFEAIGGIAGLDI